MELIKIQTPNGVELTALSFKSFGYVNLCYAQNRIFTVFYVDNRYHYGEILVEYAVIPEYDKLLKEDYTYDDYIDDQVDQMVEEYIQQGYSKEDAERIVYSAS